MPPVSESRKRARNKYDSEHFEYCTVKLPKGRRSEIDVAAQSQGVSRNKFIQEAVDERIKALKGK
jgi:predicted HicB family RNase H-like nuclease